MNQEKYQPSPEEIAAARLHMTLEERESSAVREIFFEQEHRLVEMPGDLEYGEYVCPAGEFTMFSGTFDGRNLQFKTSPATGNVNVFADGEALSSDEAKSLWEKIQPIAKKFSKYQKAESKALRNLQEEIASRKVRPEDENPGPNDPKFRIKDQELAHELALKEEKKRSKVIELLKKNLDNMEISENDGEFVQKLIDEISEIEVTRDRGSFLEDENTKISINNVLRIRRLDRKGNPVPDEKYEEYNRKKDILYKLLGVDRNKSQVWEAGFVNIYIHSKVYDTILSDIVVREEYETEERRVGSGSQIHIERNSKYQRKSEK